MSHDLELPCTADEALARLVAGNERFLRGEARFPTVQKEILADLAKGQRPYATILGCSDSRVPPELIFDAGFGELFIVRVAGNVVSPEVVGTLQYAGVHLQTPLFVVLGHEGCGAVQRGARTRRPAAPGSTSRIEVLLREHPARRSRDLDRGRWPPDESAARGRGGQRALDDAAAPRHAGGAGARGRGHHEARGRRLRAGHRPRPLPRLASGRGKNLRGGVSSVPRW